MGNKAKILIVDDEMIIRQGCARALSKSAYEVFTAENGRQALDILLEEGIDITLLDLKMPVMDGMALLEEIDEKKIKTLVLIITGHGTIETAVQSMKRGAYDFITKPFTPDQLRLLVNRAWEKVSLEREAAFLRQERDRSLRDIATEKSRITNIIFAMADGVIITDSEGNVVLNNASAARLVGLPPEILQGRNLKEAIRNPEMADMASQMIGAGGGDVKSVTREIEIGDNAYVRASMGLVTTDEGSPMGTVTVLQDIGHLKQLEKMKSDFVAMVAHELRAPLAAVLQNVDILSSGTLGPILPAQKQALERVSIRSSGLLNLINNLLDLSKIESGNLALNKEELDMKPVIQRVAELMRAKADECSLTLVLELPERLPTILGDPLHMEGVVTNLISNAIRYNKENGNIKVSAGPKGDYLEITVSDTGIGIPKEEIPKIFDRFYRVRSDGTRRIGGTGLGLPIVKGIVEAHLGTIEVESDCDRGTTFRIMLPSISVTGVPSPASEVSR